MARPPRAPQTTIRNKYTKKRCNDGHGTGEHGDEAEEQEEEEEEEDDDDDDDESISYTIL